MKSICFFVSALCLSPSLALAQARFAPQPSGDALVLGRTLQARAADAVSLKDKGAAGDGTTDDAAKLGLVISSAAGRRVQGVPGVYKLGTDVSPALSDTWLQIDASVSFTGPGKFRIDNLIPYQVGPTFGRNVRSATYSTTFAGYNNIFQDADFARSTVSGVPVVAKFGEGDAAVSGAVAWGGNFVGACSASGSTCWALELDCDDVSPDGNTITQCLDIHASGSHSSKYAIQVYANNANASFKDLLRINAGTHNPVDIGSGTSGAISVIAGPRLIAKYGLNWITGNFRNSEIDLPGFQVAATPIYSPSRLAISAGTTLIGTTGAAIKVIGGKNTITSARYNSGTGQETFVTGAPHGLVAGSTFCTNNMANDNQATVGLNGCYTAAAGTTGSTIVMAQAADPGNVTNLGYILPTSAILADLNVRASGGGVVYAGNADGNILQLGSTAPGTAIANSFFMSAAPAKNQVLIGAQGADANITIGMRSKGTGKFIFGNSGNGTELVVGATNASPVNYLTTTATTAGVPPSFSVAGADTNIAVAVTAKGTSGVLTSAYTAQAADPTATDIPSGQCTDWNNTTAGTYKHVCNFNGTLRSVAMH